MPGPGHRNKDVPEQGLSLILTGHCSEMGLPLEGFQQKSDLFAIYI